MLGAKVGQITVPEWVVLSNSSRRQTAEWNKKWLLGKYTAHITANYGFGGNLKAEREVVFYAFPWHIALILILILIVIYYLFKFLGSKFEIKRKGDPEPPPPSVEPEIKTEEIDRNNINQPPPRRRV
jgi:hypothetical protein